MVCGLLVLVVLLLASGCEHRDSKVVLNFWYGASHDEQVAIESMVAEFNRTHPGIHVKAQLTPQPQIIQKLLPAVAGGSPPDVVRFYTHVGGDLMARGGLLPLDDLIDRDSLDISDFYPVAIEQNTFRGRLYGMPWYLSPWALYYNRALFRAAGLDPDRPPRTWDELLAYAKKLTKRDQTGKLIQVGLLDIEWAPTLIWQNGGRLLSPDGKKVAFDSEEAVDALRFTKKLLNETTGTIQELGVFRWDVSGTANDAFYTQKAAMRLNSTFLLPDLYRYAPNMDFGVAPAPYSKVRTAEVVGNSLVIPKGTKHPDEAWEFVKVATSRGVMVQVCKPAGRIPARKSAAMSPEYYGDPILRVFIDEIPSGTSLPNAPGFPEARRAKWDAEALVLRDKVGVRQGVAEAARRAQAALDSAKQDVSHLPKIDWQKTLSVSAALTLTVAVIGFGCTRRRTARKRLARAEAATAIALLSPWLVGLLLFVFGASVASLVLSFSRWDVVTDARWVGLTNYLTMLRGDPLLLKSIGNSAFYTAFAVPLAVIFGLGASLLLNQKVKGVEVFRLIYYLPVIAAGVATSFVWLWMFHPEHGLFSLAMLGLENLGVPFIPTRNWLGDPLWAKPAFIVMSLWTVGSSMIIYLAGLQSVPKELEDAAKVDGAGVVRRFFSVTLPLLTPTILFHVIVATIGSFQIFTQAYIMTNGEPENSTLFYVLYLFRNAFEFMKMGYASAMAWVLFLVVLVITIIQLKSSSRWVFYEHTEPA